MELILSLFALLRNLLSKMELKYFKRSEFDCKCGCGGTIVSDKLLQLLDDAREFAKIPFVITSGYRCQKHHDDLTSRGYHTAKTSAHLKGLAVDIKCSDSKSRAIILDALGYVGFKRFGVAKSFIHTDIDSDKPSPVMWLY